MSNREQLSENLMTFVPLLFKRLMKGFPGCEIPKQQLELLFMIASEDGRPMTYYSEKMMVSKPNLTVIADKLIEEGFIERGVDANDRRIIILKITPKGSEFLCRQKTIAKAQMVKKLDTYEDEDVQRLNELIEEMKSIFNKVKKN